MPALDVVPVDPFDDAAVDAWHAVYAASLRHGRDPLAATAWTVEELRVLLQDSSDRTFQQAWAGRVGDDVVAAGQIEGSNRHNLDGAEVFVGTRPESRGRGYGSAVLARLEQEAARRGRRLLSSEVAWPYDADPDGAGVDEVTWATDRGYRLGLVDIQRQVEVPIADALLDELADRAAAYHQGYTVRSFVGPVPEELLAGWVALSSSLMTEAPMGGIEREVQQPDLAGAREQEARTARQGRTKVNTLVLAPDGDVVAYTDIALTRHEPEKAYQWGTLVRRDHRGHRLGMAVKVANLRLLQEHLRAEALAVHRLVTWNAEVNAHMIGVNEQLGFFPVERMGELQKRHTD